MENAPTAITDLSIDLGHIPGSETTNPQDLLPIYLI